MKSPFSNKDEGFENPSDFKTLEGRAKEQSK